MIYVFEKDPSGHRITYLKLVIKHFENTSANYRLLLSQRVIEELDSQIDCLYEKKWVIAIRDSDTLLGLSTQFNIRRPSVVLVLDGDPYLASALIACIRRPQLSIRLLVMQNPWWIIRSFQDHKLRQLGRNVLKLLILGFAFAQPNLSLRLLTYPRVLGGRVPRSKIFVEDPVLVEENPLPIDSPPALEKDRKWIGIVGSISSRKNPQLLADAIEDLSPPVSGGLGVALLGPLSPDIELGRFRERLNARGVVVVVDSRVRTNGEMNADVNSLDVVCMLYSTSAPNSTAAKAAFYGKSILAAGSLKYRQFVLLTAGVQATELDPILVSRQLNKVLSSSSPNSLRYSDPSKFAVRLLAP